MNLSKARKGLKDPKFDCQTKEEVLSYLYTHGLSKRHLLGGIKSLFDPLGLATPVESTLKLFYRKFLLEVPAAGYNDQVPAAYFEKFSSLMESVLWVKTQMSVERSFAPPPNCHDLVDAAMGHGAKAVNVYLHHKWWDPVKGIQAKSCLVFAKSKINKIASTSHQVTEEIAAGRLGVDTMDLVERYIKVKIHKRFVFSDSCTFTYMLRKSSMAYDSTISSTIELIQRKLNIEEEFFHIPGTFLQLSVDRATRPCLHPHLHLTETWWTGGLDTPREDWPLTPQEFFTSKSAHQAALSSLPHVNRILICLHDQAEPDTSSLRTILQAPKQVAEMSPFEGLIRSRRGYTHAIRTISNTFLFALKSSREYRERTAPEGANLVTLAMQQAKTAILRAEYPAAMEAGYRYLGKTSNFHFQDEGGVLYILGRRGANPRPMNTTNRSHLLPVDIRQYKAPVLNVKGALAEGILQEFHDKWHLKTPAHVNAMVSKHFCIPQAMRKIKSIAKACHACQKLRTREVPVEMGPVPGHRLQPLPSFAFLIDIIGPYTATESPGKTTRSGRVKPLKKIYLLIASCSYTRGVFISPMESLQAQDLMAALYTLFAQTGAPRVIWADAGSQMKAVAGQEEVEHGANEAEEEGDLAIPADVLDEMSGSLGALAIDFKTATPKASWRSGGIKSLIKIFKSLFGRTLTRDSKMSSIAIIHLAMQAANCINEWPPYDSSDPRETLFLSPNSLSQSDMQEARISSLYSRNSTRPTTSNNCEYWLADSPGIIPTSWREMWCTYPITSDPMDFQRWALLQEPLIETPLSSTSVTRAGGLNYSEPLRACALWYTATNTRRPKWIRTPSLPLSGQKKEFKQLEQTIKETHLGRRAKGAGREMIKPRKLRALAQPRELGPEEERPLQHRVLAQEKEMMMKTKTATREGCLYPTGMIKTAQ